jgi:hypothetical protein
MFKHEIEINASEALTDAQLDVISGGVIVEGNHVVDGPVCKFPSGPVYGDNPLSISFAGHQG